MAPLPCSPVSDLYGKQFGLSHEQIAELNLINNQKCAKENQKYQQNLLETEVAGKAKFKETYPNTTSPLPSTENYSEPARRLGYTNTNNTWPTNQGFSMFNRLQNVFGDKEYFASSTESDCLNTLVRLMKELLLIAKIIMFILVLFFLIKILEKN